MSFKVGIPCMKCSLHPSRQTNSRTGKSSKTCSIDSAWKEMNDDRMGRDTTIDKSLTSNNIWMEGSTSDNVTQIVQTEIDIINAERKAHGLRSLRSDAVSVVEIIEKPPIEYMQNLTYDQKKTFLFDSHDTMKTLIHKWNPDWKIIESVQHHDEFGGLSAHNHSFILLTSVDGNGIATMNAKSEFNLKFFSHINKNYAEQMRQKGYDVEDCLTYDMLSDDEKEERRLHPEQHGVDSYIYKQEKIKEQDELLNRKYNESMDLSDKISSKRSELSIIETDLSLKKKAISTVNQQLEDSKQRLVSIKHREDIANSTIAEAEHKKAEYIAKQESADNKERLYNERLRYLLRLTGATDIQSYSEILNENASLKVALQRKDKVIEELRSKYNKMCKVVDEWRQKFQDISHRAGAKLMSLLGYDLSKDHLVQPYPDKKVSVGISSMLNEIQSKCSQNYRVIPDDQEPGKFRIAYLDNDGTYQTVCGGLESRDAAENTRKNITDITNTFNRETSLKNGLK